MPLAYEWISLKVELPMNKTHFDLSKVSLQILTLVTSSQSITKQVSNTIMLPCSRQFKKKNEILYWSNLCIATTGANILNVCWLLYLLLSCLHLFSGLRPSRLPSRCGCLPLARSYCPWPASRASGRAAATLAAAGGTNLSLVRIVLFYFKKFSSIYKHTVCVDVSKNFKADLFFFFCIFKPC